MGVKEERHFKVREKGRAHRQGWTSRLGSLDYLVKNKMELKNVESRAFLTVCEVTQLLTKRSC